MSTLPHADYQGKATRLALRVAMALAMVCSSFAPARAANDSIDASNPAGATEAAGTANAAVEDNDAAAQLPQSSVRRRQSGSPLDRRVNLLAKELGLDAAQRAQVRKLLERQRDDVARVWSEESTPPARRVSATQAIGDRTADQIRALLNDEQRKKYMQPRQRKVAVGTAGGDVESWINSTQRK